MLSCNLKTMNFTTSFKTSLKQNIAIFFVTSLLGFAGVFSNAFAASPNLNATPFGTNNVVAITISGSLPNSNVALYERQGSGLLYVYSNFGQTDSQGNLSSYAGLVTDGTFTQIAIYAVIGGMTSNTVYVTPVNGTLQNNNQNNQNTNNGSLSLSQTSVSLNVGQSISVIIYNYSSGNSYNISGNTNSNVVTANISGSNVNLYGLNSGTSNVSVCQNFGQCTTIFVNVSNNFNYNNYNNYNNNNYNYNNGNYNNGNYSNLTFSNQNPTLTVGQTLNVTI